MSWCLNKFSFFLIVPSLTFLYAFPDFLNDIDKISVGPVSILPVL